MIHQEELDMILTNELGYCLLKSLNPILNARSTSLPIAIKIYDNLHLHNSDAVWSKLREVNESGDKDTDDEIYSTDDEDNGTAHEDDGTGDEDVCSGSKDVLSRDEVDVSYEMITDDRGDDNVNNMCVSDKISTVSEKKDDDGLDMQCNDSGEILFDNVNSENNPLPTLNCTKDESERIEENDCAMPGQSVDISAVRHADVEPWPSRDDSDDAVHNRIDGSDNIDLYSEYDKLLTYSNDELNFIKQQRLMTRELDVLFGNHFENIANCIHENHKIYGSAENTFCRQFYLDQASALLKKEVTLRKRKTLSYCIHTVGIVTLVALGWFFPGLFVGRTRLDI